MNRPNWFLCCSQQPKINSDEIAKRFVIYHRFDCMVEWARQTFHIAICSFLLTHRHGMVTVLLNFINDLFPWYSGHGTYKHSIDDLCIFPFSTTQQHFYMFLFYFEELQFDHFVCKVYLSWNCKNVQFVFTVSKMFVCSLELKKWKQKIISFIFQFIKNSWKNHKKNNPSEIFNSSK